MNTNVKIHSSYQEEEIVSVIQDSIADTIYVPTYDELSMLENTTEETAESKDVVIFHKSQ